MPSAVVIAYRVLTDGLLFSVSIWEIRLAETPISRARPRALTPFRIRSSRIRSRESAMWAGRSKGTAAKRFSIRSGSPAARTLTGTDARSRASSPPPAATRGPSDAPAQDGPAVGAASRASAVARRRHEPRRRPRPEGVVVPLRVPFRNRLRAAAGLVVMVVVLGTVGAAVIGGLALAAAAALGTL